MLRKKIPSVILIYITKLWNKDSLTLYTCSKVIYPFSQNILLKNKHVRLLVLKSVILVELEMIKTLFLNHGVQFLEMVS